MRNHIFQKLSFLLLFIFIIGVFGSNAQEPWRFRPERNIKFPMADSLVFPYLCTTDNLNNLWVISSTAVAAKAKNALFKAAPGDTVFTLVADYSTDLNIESTRGITAIGDTIYVSARIPGTPMPSLAIVYEYLDGDPLTRKSYSGSGYGTWVLGLSANKDGYIYASLSYKTSIRVYNFSASASPRGAWVPILPIELHPSEPAGHDGTGQSIIRDVAVIPGADYSNATTPFFTSRNGDSTGAKGGIAIWTGGVQTDPKGYTGQRVTDVASDLSWLWWTPYGITADRAGNLYACGTDTTRRWVKVFSIMGAFAIEVEELPSQNSKSSPQPNGAPLLVPSDVALSPDEQTAYVIDEDAKKAFVFTRGQVGVETKELDVIKGYRLYQNYPNPFNSSTTISYQLPEKSFVRLEIVDLLGRQMAVLVNQYQEAGSYRIDFDAKNLMTGIYFYRLKTDRYNSLGKMVLIR